MKRLILMLIAVIITTTSMANFKQYGNFFLDVDSISTVNNPKRILYSYSIQHPTLPNQIAKTNAVVNCNEQTYYVEQQLVLNSSGNYLRDIPFDHLTPLKHKPSLIRKKTIQYEIYKEYCLNK